MNTARTRWSLGLGAILAVLAAALTGSGALGASGADAAEKVRVVTTIPDLKSLTEAVGGDLVEVESLARGTQNLHEAEVRPSMMLKLRRADLLIENGLELDSWAEVAVQGANNPKIVRGAPGRIEVSRGIPVLEVPGTRVDRSMGDVHPLGNPHFSLDPGMAPIITQNILDGLARVAPQHRAAFEQNRQAFLARLDGELARWMKMMEPVKGAKVVVYHPDFIYFLTRFGLVQVGTIEDRPGIPPSPGHLARLIQQMKQEKVKVVLVEPWNDKKLAERVAQEADAKAFVMASAVGAVKGADNYIAAIDFNIRTLAEGLR
jgi:ABC-type Zn uptake system ZnuABC Zn-binding protein ZnuA